MASISPITVARFWSKVSVTPSNNDCWEWNGCVNRDGYGNFRIPQFGRFNFGAHRVSYMLYHGDFPPKGQLVRHRCDNPRCVNPLHLEPGTKKDNSQDMIERGRVPVVDRKGENNGAAKLSMEKVREIRRRSSLGESNKSIARDFGVTHQLISKIKLGYFWREPEATDGGHA